MHLTVSYLITDSSTLPLRDNTCFVPAVGNPFEKEKYMRFIEGLGGVFVSLRHIDNEFAHTANVSESIILRIALLGQILRLVITCGLTVTPFPHGSSIDDFLHRTKRYYRWQRFDWLELNYPFRRLDSKWHHYWY